MSQELSSAERLLQRNLQQFYKTGEVLETEFRLIHGDGKWDPADRRACDDRAKLIRQATHHFKRPLPAMPVATEAQRQARADAERAAEDEAERLALHAWSVRNLPDQTALCLSGGGIRSAAFALGVLQGLARQNLLHQFHYLSTVSGGGYIGSWLTAWRHRTQTDPIRACLHHRGFGDFTEPTPLQRLRFNQNFLTPKVGLLSADTWAVLGMIVRNLLLNWLVFLPLLAGLLLMPRIVQAFIYVMDLSDAHDPSVPAYPSFKTLLSYLWVPHYTAEGMPGIKDLGNWRSWVDSAAIALVLLGFSISAYHRPASGPTTLTQTGFVKWVALPVMAGAVLLTGAITAWVPQMTGSGIELVRWAYCGVIVYVLARLIAAGCAFLYRGSVSTPGSQLLLEILGWAVAGICTGLLVGVGAHLCLKLAQASSLAPDYDKMIELIKGAIKHERDIDYDVAKIIAVCGPVWIISSFLLGEVVYVGATSRLPCGERDREWLGRASGWCGIFAVSYLVFSWLVLFGWGSIDRAWYLTGVGGAGLFSLIGALAPLTRATAATASKEKIPMTGIVAALSGLFILGASAALAQATLDFLDPVARFVNWSLGLPITGESADRKFNRVTELVLIAATCFILMGGSAAIALCVNVNFFSLHALYRNRLVKTFLGASNVQPTREAEERNAFDGFSERDNLGMAELYRRMEEGKVNLYPVLNVSLNVLATHNLAWQERKAEPFVCTPVFTGGDRVGYRPSALYCAGLWGSLSEPKRGISLGTAMAISGAAVSPNWGYHSSPITSFLMMLANVRLGWWLGNPKNKKTWRYSGPSLSWRLFLQEALGWTDDEEPWVYLSDGGHFENLGLYEMVRRRCRTIVVSDAGADPKCTLEDLGNAVRKIAIDLGVKVEFDRIQLRRRSDTALAGVYCAYGKILYPEGNEGRIVYFKPGFYGTEEPADVRAYAAANAKFPHESTTNQWFGESQFESYRSLGAFVIAEIFRKARNGKNDMTPRDFADRVHSYLEEFQRSQVNGGPTVVDFRRRIAAAAR